MEFKEEGKQERYVDICRGQPVFLLVELVRRLASVVVTILANFDTCRRALLSSLLYQLLAGITSEESKMIGNQALPGPLIKLKLCEKVANIDRESIGWEADYR